jgi:outer membrane cobalamin receptor
METVLQDNSTGIQEYKLWQNNEQQWKVGAKIHYHYKDIIDVNLAGNYYFYPMDPNSQNVNETTTFDRPNWDAYARIDAHIDSKWSIYSENYFMGSRWAYVNKDKQQLKPTISLNIGGQYTINKWLHVYLQLNNYLNRKNDIFYGYQSQGCHFLAGVKYKF